MLLKALSVRDTKGGYYGAPFFAPSLGEGERTFIKLVRDPQTNINQFPEDFELFHVGDYDTESAKLTALNTPTPLMKASQARNQ